jgi:hypothetical protein
LKASLFNFTITKSHNVSQFQNPQIPRQAASMADRPMALSARQDNMLEIAGLWEVLWPFHFNVTKFYFTVAYVAYQQKYLTSIISNILIVRTVILSLPNIN